jgi:Tfp pilus assembly protein PilX
MISTRFRGRRRGFVAAALVMILIVLVVLGGGLLRVAWLRHSDLRAAERRLQAEWLAESALDRASARLSDDPNYTGETWNVPADRLGGRDSATVLIEVKPSPGRADRRVVRARADYPKAEARRARQSREITIVVPPNTPERKGDTPR